MRFDVISAAVVAGAVVAWLVARVFVRSHAAATKRKAEVAALGFVPSPEEAEHLRRLVRVLRGAPNAEVHDLHKRGTGERAVYWYHVHVHKTDAPIDAEEFLFACKPLAARRFALFLQPATLPDGRVMRLLAAMLARVSALAPAGVEPIEIPRQLRSKLLTALGPSGRTLYELIDDRTLSRFIDSAPRGFIAVRVAEGHCAMELISAWGRKALPGFDWRQAAGSSLEVAARLA